MPAGPPLPVVVNRAGGTASSRDEALSDELRHAFAAAGITIALELVEGDELAAALRRFRGAPRIAVGGGDGTLGAAAGILAGSATELAVLPLGTRNHFARQLGIPLDLRGAAGVAADGRVRSIDLGDAGGRAFINNASLGAYVELVRDREASPLPKAPASIVAGWRVLRKLRAKRYRLAIDGDVRRVATPLLFFGNNRYEIDDGRIGERTALDEGVLSVFALAPMRFGALVHTAIRTALGRADLARNFSISTTAHKVRIDGKGEIAIALDGERTSLPLPLEIAVCPRALKVVVPNG